MTNVMTFGSHPAGYTIAAQEFTVYGSDSQPRPFVQINIQSTPDPDTGVIEKVSIRLTPGEAATFFAAALVARELR